MAQAKTAPHQKLPQVAAVALGESLRNRRADACLTQEELAGHAHVSVQMIRRLESGTSNPTVATLAAITAALGVTVADVLTDAGI